MSNNLKEIRWKQRFSNFEKSYKLLESYRNVELNNEIEKAGFIQFFEICFELSWKLMKDYLESEGFIIKSPRETIKTALQNELINEAESWFSGLEDRNLSTHTYDEDLIDELISDIKNIYLPQFSKLYDKLLKEL